MKKCVLVVDDEIGIRRALARELRRTFDTRVADCGTAAVAEVDPPKMSRNSRVHTIW